MISGLVENRKANIKPGGIIVHDGSICAMETPHLKDKRAAAFIIYSEKTPPTWN